MIYTILGLGIVGTFLYVIFKELKPSMAVMVSMAASTIILVVCLNSALDIVSQLTRYLAKINVSSDLLYYLFKIVGVSFLVEFIADIAQECGGQSIAAKIALGGKIVITGLSLPILFELLDIGLL